MLETVRSPQNAKLKTARAISAGRERALLLLDGAHLLDDALSAGKVRGIALGIAPKWVLVAEERQNEPEMVDLLERSHSVGAEIGACEAKLLAELSELDSPTGVLAVCPRPQFDLSAVMGSLQVGELMLVCAGVKEPGNVGAIVRVAAGLGAAAVICLQGCASPWSPRALRGASGTTLRLPVGERISEEQLVQAARQHGVELWSAEAGGEDLSELNKSPRTAPIALLLGGEGGGVPAEISTTCVRRISIPLTLGVESLNVATAAAVLSWALLARGEIHHRDEHLEVKTESEQ